MKPPFSRATLSESASTQEMCCAGIASDKLRDHLGHVRWSSNYGYYLQLAAAIGWSSLPWLPFLRQPTLVMAGTDDPIVPVINGRILAKLIPDSQFVTIDDGHLFLLTSAKQSAGVIAEFLNQGQAADAALSRAPGISRAISAAETGGLNR